MGALVLSATAVEKEPYVCLLGRRGEDQALEESLGSLVAAETRGLVVLATEEGVRVPKDAKGVYAHLRLPLSAKSLIGKAWRALPFQDRDVIFVRAGLRLSRNFDILLASVACLDGAIGAVSPVCARDPYFSLTPQGKKPFPDPDAVNAWLQSAHRTKVFDAPVFLRSCVFFRHAALADLETDLADLSDDELAQALRRAGWTLVGFEGLYVDDSRSAWEPHDPLLERREDVSDFLHHHPLTGLRWAFEHRPAHKELPKTMEPIRPTQLHVAHSWGGGLGQWVEDFVAADGERRNLVLRSIGTWGRFGQRLALYLGGNPVPLRQWELSLPIRATAVSHYEYKQILEEITGTFGVEVVFVSSVIGHSLDLLNTQLKTVVVFHDYYPICPYLYLHFQRECAQCTESLMADCFARNTLPQIFRNVSFQEWSVLRDAFVHTILSRKIPLVAPSASVFRNLFRVEPRLAATEHHIIPHGLPPFLAEGRRPAHPRRSKLEGGKGLHILVPGRVSEEKGKAILLQLVKALPQPFRFTLLGCGEDGAAFRKFSNVRLIAHYRREELPGIIEELKPDLGLLTSVVPETFSYTLSELWALGVPPVVTKVGSFLDRVEDGVTGWLTEPTFDSIVDTLRHLDASPHLIERVASHLEGIRARTCSDMVEDYHRLTSMPFSSRHRGLRFPTQGEESLDVLTPPRPALHIDPQAPFRHVVVQFLEYTHNKVQSTPRLGRMRRKVIAFLLKLLTTLMRPGSFRDNF